MQKQLIELFDRIVQWIKSKMENLSEWEEEMRETLVKFLQNIYETVQAELKKAESAGKETLENFEMPKVSLS